MTETWVKLYRKAKYNDLIKDATAWQLFSFILLSVNHKTGKYKTGRIRLSEALGVNQSTIYKALKRLERSYKVLSLLVTTKYTEITVLNWAKYQSKNTTGNNKVTTKEQQSNTIQEYKNIKNIQEDINNMGATPDLEELIKPNNKASTEGQVEALRVAEMLKIDLNEACKVDPSLRGRWFALFKNKQNNGALQIAYAYLYDLPVFQKLKADEKIKMVFWKFNNPYKEAYAPDSN